LLVLHLGEALCRRCTFCTEMAARSILADSLCEFREFRGPCCRFKGPLTGRFVRCVQARIINPGAYIDGTTTSFLLIRLGFVLEVLCLLGWQQRGCGRAVCVCPLPCHGPLTIRLHIARKVHSRVVVHHHLGKQVGLCASCRLQTGSRMLLWACSSEKLFCSPSTGCQCCLLGGVKGWLHSCQSAPAHVAAGATAARCIVGWCCIVRPQADGALCWRSCVHAETEVRKEGCGQTVRVCPLSRREPLTGRWHGAGCGQGALESTACIAILASS
jgi:hypothetical protein